MGAWIKSVVLRGPVGSIERETSASDISRNIDALLQVGLRAMALLLLLFTLPMTLPIALLIRLESRGAVLFRQQRLGKNGHPFEIVKFRTMYEDGDARLNAHLQQKENERENWLTYHKLSNDPRITKVGSVLRRLSFDEVPQLLNIAMGEMSFVGPRPYMVHEQSEMRGLDKVILSVRPGLTGLWQVSGRNELTFDERLDLDAKYVRERSLAGDIAILRRTIGAVASAKGAM